MAVESLVPKMRDPSLTKVSNHGMQISINQRVLIGCKGGGGSHGLAGPFTDAFLHLGDGLFSLGSGGPMETCFFTVLKPVFLLAAALAASSARQFPCTVGSFPFLVPFAIQDCYLPWEPNSLEEF